MAKGIGIAAGAFVLSAFLTVLVPYSVKAETTEAAQETTQNVQNEEPDPETPDTASGRNTGTEPCGETGCKQL